MLLGSPNFWENEGRGNYANYTKKIFLKITKHANDRIWDSNIKPDSLLALTQMFCTNKQLNSLAIKSNEQICVRYFGENEFENILTFFTLKTLKSGDLIATAITVYRMNDSKASFWINKTDRMFELFIQKDGTAEVKEIYNVLRK